MLHYGRIGIEVGIFSSSSGGGGGGGGGGGNSAEGDDACELMGRNTVLTTFLKPKYSYKSKHEDLIKGQMEGV